jgi:CBS domain-containing protein
LQSGNYSGAAVCPKTYPAYDTSPMKIPLSVLHRQKGTAVHSVPLSASVQAAAEAMAANNIGSIVVLDGGNLAGIFTERDLLMRVVAPGLPGTTPISQVMSPQPTTVTPELTLDKAMALISEKRMRHLPVVEGGQLVGLVSIGDITKWVVEHLQFEADTLRGYISGQYPG